MHPKTKTASVYELQAEICGALAHPVRLQILDLLGKKEMTSSDLLGALEIPKANLSQHLSVLRDAGLVKARKEGLFQYLSLALPRIKDACSLVQALLLERMDEEQRLHTALRRELRK